MLVTKWRQILTRQWGCILHLLCQIVNNGTTCKTLENQTPYVLKSAEPFISLFFQMGNSTNSTLPYKDFQFQQMNMFSWKRLYMEILPTCRPLWLELPQPCVPKPATLTQRGSRANRETPLAPWAAAKPRHGTACGVRNEWDCHLKCEEHIGPDSLQIWVSAFQSQEGKQRVSALPAFPHWS